MTSKVIAIKMRFLRKVNKKTKIGLVNDGPVYFVTTFYYHTSFTTLKNNKVLNFHMTSFVVTLTSEKKHNIDSWLRIQTPFRER